MEDSKFKDYEDDIRPFISDDEDAPKDDLHYLSTDTLKYAKEILPR